MESALMTSPSKTDASLTARDVFPLPVGPAIMTAFGISFSGIFLKSYPENDK
jgi:hypothetical protein